MELNICEDKIYQRPWGKHKNGFIKLIYNSGSYATVNKIKNNNIVESRIIEIKCKDGDYSIEKFAQENNLIKLSEEN